MIEIGPMRFVWGWPGWGWKMYGVIWRKSQAFVGVSRKAEMTK